MEKVVNTIHDPVAWDDFAEAVGAQFAAQTPDFSTQARLVRADGSRFWAIVSFIVVPDEASGSRHVCATYRKIPDLQDEEAMAQNAHARLVSALNAHPDPILIHDQDLALVCWNHAHAIQMTDSPDALKEDIPLREVLSKSYDIGQFPTAGSDKEARSDHIVSPETLGRLVEGMETNGDNHQRLLRSWTYNGDIDAICLDTRLANRRISLQN